MRLRPPPARPRRLRTKLSLLLGLIALLTSVGVATLTYYLARDALLDQRTNEARQRAVLNASSVRGELAVGLENFSDSLQGMPESTGFVQVAVAGDDGVVERFGGPLQFTDPDLLPAALRSSVAEGVAASQRFSIDGEHFIGVGIPLTDLSAEFYEAVSLESTESTLNRVLLLLAAGSSAAVLLAGAGGIWAGRRVLRPLGNVVEAAEEIASGDLTTRVGRQTDADLEPLVDAFNGMADAVQQRVEREARFASDVSHELRSPITALRAATDLIDKRRDELPDRTRQVIDVIVTQVRRFDGMVLDLLELARMDAGAADVHLEQVDVAAVAGRTASRVGVDVPFLITDRSTGPVWVRVDRLRFDRILSNLLNNAEIHGGGATAITVTPDVRLGVDDPHRPESAEMTATYVDVAVEDHGPGVADHERQQIFERYTRGSESRNRVGTGLGLALVAEHAKVIGGITWVEDRVGGGSRFVVRLLAADDADDDQPESVR